MSQSQALTNNPFGHATKEWLRDHMYPPNKTTKVDAGVLLPQQRSGGQTGLHTYLCGRGLFELTGTYDPDFDRMVDTSIHFNVPFYGRLEFVTGLTQVLRRPIRIEVPKEYDPITGHVEILETDTDEPTIALKYNLTTPYGNLVHSGDGLPLFPVNSASLQAKSWYKDIPIMEEHTVAALRAMSESHVKRGSPDVGYEHVVFAAHPNRYEQQGRLLALFFANFARDGHILIPATPRYSGAVGHAAGSPSKQKTIRLRFLNFFQLNGTINLETLYINAILSTFIPVAHNAHTCQIRGNLGDVAGVVVVLDEPLMHGLVNLDCDPNDAEKKVYVTLKMTVSLIGAIKEVNYPLLALSKLT